MPLTIEQLLSKLSALEKTYKAEHWFYAKHKGDIEQLVGIYPKRKSNYNRAQDNLRLAKDDSQLARTVLAVQLGREELSDKTRFSALITEMQKNNENIFTWSLRNCGEHVKTFEETIFSKFAKAENDTFSEQQALYTAIRYKNLVDSALKDIIEDLKGKFNAGALTKFGDSPSNLRDFINKINSEPSDHTFYREIGLILKDHLGESSIYANLEAPVRIHTKEMKGPG